MSAHWLLQNCRVVADGVVREADVRVRDGRIARIDAGLTARPDESVVDADGRYLFPGLIDDQVHFRQPGLTHKADIYSESRAAVAGGVTSFMDMPNVKPLTLSMELLEEKRAIAARDSLANYAFYLGASNDNLDAVAAADPCRIAGVKIFMGASTGNFLVDDAVVLEKIFAAAPTLIATHCENTPRINRRFAEARRQHGDDLPAAMHAHIRDEQACYQSSSLAVDLAKKTAARLHILHITTAAELALFEPGFSREKRITAEACAHHLLFDDGDYERLGMRLKCNPAVKGGDARAAVRAAVADGRIDVLATDHAPHLLSEKMLPYAQAAAGMPLVEYALPAFLELAAEGVLSVTDVARCAAERVADLFAVHARGYIREGYYADLVLVEETPAGTPVRPTVLSKCGWTPFAGGRFRHRVVQTFVNGRCVYRDDNVRENESGMALEFNRAPSS